MARKKVVVADTIDSGGLEMLNREAEVVYLPELPGRTLLDEMKDAYALIVRGKTKVDRSMLEQAGKLLVIAKHGVGYDNIDVEAATQRHMVVVNTPEANTESVAEHNLGLMLSLTKKICSSDRALRLATFKRREDFTGIELKDKKLGIIGMGRIGSELARKCVVAFNMRVTGFDPYVSKEKMEQLGYRKVAKLEDLLRESDYVVLCVPLTKETRNLISSKELGLMKASAFLINSSRGGIVDEGALHDCLVKKRIAGAALDVFSQEPPSSNHPLLSLDNFIATPHIAGVTTEALRRMATTAAEEVLRVLRGDKPRYAINPQVFS